MVAALVALALLQPDPLDVKIAQVVPTAAEEKWLQIPWRLNVIAARRDAQQSGKPMFLWIMNGHPFGCT
jgi:hypothetical protein